MGSLRAALTAIMLRCLVIASIAMAPSPAGAEADRSLHRIGVLNDAWAANHPTVDGLKAGLRDLGLAEGRDVTFDVPITHGSRDGIAAAAEALAKAGASVIVTSGDAATLAARRATQTIPIVFTLVGDPVGARLVPSLTHPTGNLTGVSSLTTALVAKRLEALKDLAPGLRRVWVISDDVDPAGGVAINRAIEIGSRFAIEVVPRTVQSRDDLGQLIEALRPGDALLVPDIAAMEMSAVLLETSLARRIPALFSSELWVRHGGLVSYGADYRGQGVQAARLVAKILRGARPADLPVEPADPVVLAVNLKTAAALGLVVPRQLLFRADVIRR